MLRPDIFHTLTPFFAEVATTGAAGADSGAAEVFFRLGAVAGWGWGWEAGSSGA